MFETQFRSFRARRLFTGWSPWSLFDLRRHFLKQVLPLELIVPILTAPSQLMLEHQHSQSEDNLPDFPSKFLLFCSAGQYLKMCKRKNWGSLNWPAPMIPPLLDGGTQQRQIEKKKFYVVSCSQTCECQQRKEFIFCRLITQSPAWYNIFRKMPDTPDFSL